MKIMPAEKIVENITMCEKIITKTRLTINRYVTNGHTDLAMQSLENLVMVERTLEIYISLDEIEDHTNFIKYLNNLQSANHTLQKNYDSKRTEAESNFLLNL